MAQIHELITESNVGVGLDFVTDNGESTGKVGFAALAGGVLEKYEETELAGQRRSVKRAIADLAQQVDDAVEDVAALKTAGSGLTDEARTLLLTILRNAVFTSNQTGNIEALNEALNTDGGSDSPDTPDEPTESDEISVKNGVMTILSLANAPTVANGIMTIA